MGHRVVAVEPTAALRTRAAILHPSPRIELLDDSLPELQRVLARCEVFDVVMLTAVWMHLDARQRRRAMLKVARLVRGNGVMIISLRRGPVPPGRRIFTVSPEETVRLAQVAGFSLVLIREMPSVLRANQRVGVSWTRLAFVKAREHPQT
jgi:SAM-dependent methyltransferase